MDFMEEKKWPYMGPTARPSAREIARQKEEERREALRKRKSWYEQPSDQEDQEENFMGKP